jgi:hypothetical protein
VPFADLVSEKKEKEKKLALFEGDCPHLGEERVR